MRADHTPPSPPPRRRLSLRHRLPVRCWHWFNLWCLIVLLMSGLQIFNAHPALYWGSASNFSDPWLEMYAVRTPEGAIEGVTALGPWQFNTTGVLGYSRVGDQPALRGFPDWITLPSYQSLSSGRLWHFLFGWLFAVSGALFVIYSLISGHFRRSLWPGLREWRHMGRDILNHLKFRFNAHRGKYNSLQKLSYFSVIFIALPMMIVTGLGMSPTINAAAPWLLDLLGGRQSARSLHFIIAFSLIVFVVVHVLLVLLTHPLRQLRGMITGYTPSRRRTAAEREPERPQ